MALADAMAHRIEQVNELLRATLAQVAERTLEFPPGVIVTFKRVITSRDLSAARVWVSILPVERSAETLALLQQSLPELQRLVAERVVLQFMPKFRLLLDESEERAQRVTDLLDRLGSSK